MDTRDKVEILKNALSPYKDYCEGYGNTGSSGNSYILGTVLSVGKVKKQFSHSGSTTLDEINAFDVAEVDSAYIGQINMSIVSSFCGPQGLIWGYDLCKSESYDDNSAFLMNAKHEGIELPVYSITPLMNATKELFGTVDKWKFPLKPGAHVPFASKNMKTVGPGRVYSAIAMGIAKDREKHACLLMEDFGKIVSEHSIEDYETKLLEQIAKSVIQVGINQHVEYERVLVGIKSVYAEDDEIVCALIAAPYFTLAQNALISNDCKKTVNSNLREWIKSV